MEGLEINRKRAKVVGYSFAVFSCLFIFVICVLFLSTLYFATYAVFAVRDDALVNYVNGFFENLDYPWSNLAARDNVSTGLSLFIINVLLFFVLLQLQGATRLIEATEKDKKTQYALDLVAYHQKVQSWFIAVEVTSLLLQSYCLMFFSHYFSTDYCFIILLNLVLRISSFYIVESFYAELLVKLKQRIMAKVTIALPQSEKMAK